MAATVMTFKAFVNTTGIGTRDTHTSGVDILMPTDDIHAAGVGQNADWFRDLLAACIVPTSVIMKIVVSKTFDNLSNKLPRSRSRKFEYEQIGGQTVGMDVEAPKPMADYVRLAIEKRVADGRNGFLLLSGALDAGMLTGAPEAFKMLDGPANAINNALEALGPPPAGSDVIPQKPGHAPVSITGYQVSAVVDRDITAHRISYVRQARELAKRRVRELAKAEEILNPEGTDPATLTGPAGVAVNAIKTELDELFAQYGAELIAYGRIVLSEALKTWLGL